MEGLGHQHNTTEWRVFVESSNLPWRLHSSTTEMNTHQNH